MKSLATISGSGPAAGASPRRDGYERGIALILSMLVLTILIIVVFQLSYTTKVSLRLAKNRLDQATIRYAFDGVVIRAKAYLEADARENTWDSASDLWASADFSDGAGTDEWDDEYSYGYDDSMEPWSDDSGEESRMELDVAIIDEERKLNISMMREKPRQPRENSSNRRDRNQRRDRSNRNSSDRERQLVNRVAEKKIRERVFEGLISILVEFRDQTPYALSGSDARRFAENIREYVTRPVRHDTNDDEIPTPDTIDYPLLTVDELLLIDEVTEDLLYDFEDPNNEGSVIPGLLNFITVWSSGLVNINTAPEVVLRSILEKKDRDLATDILEYREQMEEEQDTRSGSSRSRDEDEEESSPGVFKDVSELQNEVLDNEAYQDVLPFITTQSTVFSVHVNAKRGKVSEHKRAVLRRVGTEVYSLFNETRSDRLLWGREEALEEMQGGDFLF